MENNIIIVNPQDFEEKKKKFLESGKDKVHVISDFDRTFTSGSQNGKRNPSLIAYIRDGKYLTQEYPEKSQNLYNHYRPIEIDDSLSVEERSRKMDEWWRKHFDLLMESGMNKEVIEDIVRKNDPHFRGGSLEFIGTLNGMDIPLVIMSAGPGQLIEEFLKKRDSLYPNVHIIANYFTFNDEGIAIARRDPPIHTFNKKEFMLKELPVYEELVPRKNVLLLGDSVGDVGMVEGFSYDNLIRIGFLNEDIEKNIEKFREAYDVVITGDSDFSYVNELLGEVVK